MHTLMTDVLGYDRYVTYGEDVTANVNDLLAATHPESFTGRGVGVARREADRVERHPSG